MRYGHLADAGSPAEDKQPEAAPVACGPKITRPAVILRERYLPRQPRERFRSIFTREDVEHEYIRVGRLEHRGVR